MTGGSIVLTVFFGVVSLGCLALFVWSRSWPDKITHYRAIWDCGNCGARFYMHLPIGTLAPDQAQCIVCKTQERVKRVVRF